MKNILLTAACSILITLSVSAQFAKGDMLVGGSILASVNTSDNIISGVTTDGPSVTTLFLGPSFGYIIHEKWMLGARVALNVSKTTLYGFDGQDLDLHYDRVSFGGGPVARYYPWQTDHVDLWIGAGAYFGVGKNTDESIGYDGNGESYIITSTDDLLNYSLGVGPGASFIFNDHWRLELACGSLGFSGYTTKEKESGNTYRQSGFALNLGSVGFGVAYAF
jgi:hypothetical protein